jgi:phage-related protein
VETVAPFSRGSDPGLDKYECILIRWRMARLLRPLLWMASSKRDYRGFPARVQDNLGFELFLAQTGQHPPSAKLLKGLGSGTVELVEDFDGDTYRCVYTVRFSDAMYVLHAFKKKSKHGIKTPSSDIEMIKRRLRDAERDYAQRFKKERE